MTSESVLSYFKEITKIPRESGHEEKIVAYLQAFAASHGLECRTDEAMNVLIIRPASKGREAEPTVILQSHSDMVCEKNAGVDHDFEKDPIHYIIENGWMIAPDTTLGADCGIGIAASLAILADPDASVPRLECLFTSSEETGMDGAFALKQGFITGKTLINLDSEDEGELFIGCSGGIDSTAVFTCSREPDSRERYHIKVFGAQGGHSGDDINKHRASAVKLLSRFLYEIRSLNPAIELFEGGGKRNAIAREAEAVVALDSAPYEFFNAFREAIRSEYAGVENDLDASAQKVQASGEVVGIAQSKAIIAAMCAAAHGPLEMSHDIQGLVETSSNIAAIHASDEGYTVTTSQRSSIVSALHAATDKVCAVFELAGAKTIQEGEYPGWKPKLDSPILKITIAAYERLFPGSTPVVRAIHAGLECGLFLENFPDLDMISFGPTLRGVHAPGERLDLDSLDKFVALLEEVLK